MLATAWILDVTHRAQRLTCDVPSDARAVPAVRELIVGKLGLSLGGPLGFRNLESAPELMYLLPRTGEGSDWRRFADWAVDDDAWSLYVEVMLGGWLPPTRALDVFYFGNTPALAAKLAHLVVKRVKRGTTAWIEAAERDGSTLPAVGLVSIVTDGFGYPLCAIQSEQVDRIRFGDVDATQAFIEGEGDRSLEDWRDAHLHYFTAEAASLGLTFTEDSLVAFEHFRVLAVLGRADG
jgi:uncharacterized protein YhfF